MTRHRLPRSPRSTEEIAQEELDKAEEMEYLQQHDEADRLRLDGLSRLKMAEREKREEGQERNP
jgi:hypothetical protein